MPEAIRRANNAKSKIRSRIEHVFAEQKDRMGLFIRTIGIARAKTKIGLANLVYNIKRLLFLRRISGGKRTHPAASRTPGARQECLRAVACRGRVAGERRTFPRERRHSRKNRYAWLSKQDSNQSIHFIFAAEPVDH
jgi:hypothetical protein